MENYYHSPNFCFGQLGLYYTFYKLICQNPPRRSPCMAIPHPNRVLPVHELEKRRMRAGRYFDNGKTAYFIEKHFGVSSATAREWRTRWQNGTLKAGHQGNASKLTEAQKKDVAKRILTGYKPLEAEYLRLEPEKTLATTGRNNALTSIRLRWRGRPDSNRRFVP